MPNRPKSHAFSDCHALAALLLVVVGACTTGCLISPEDQMFPNLPSKKNAPPRLIENSVTPPRSEEFVLHLGERCPRQVFSVDIDDDSATLSHAWFVDDHEHTKSGGDRGDSQSFTGKVRTLGANPQFVSGLPPGTKRLVEVIVTDGRFFVNTANLNALDIDSSETGLDEKGDVVPQQPFRVSCSWVVTIISGPCQ